jgi:hypothetical protein
MVGRLFGNQTWEPPEGEDLGGEDRAGERHHFAVGFVQFSYPVLSSHSNHEQGSH